MSTVLQQWDDSELRDIGLAVPEEVRDLCILTSEEIVADSEENAAEIYAFESG